MQQANPYPLRVDRHVMAKFKVIAAENGRSVNKEIEFLMRVAIRQYEAQNGPIRIAGAQSPEDIYRSQFQAESR